MHEILFRGKRTDNGEWVEGYLIKWINPLTRMPKFFILTQEEISAITGEPTGYLKIEMSRHEVDPSTVGQYTGLTDKNGKKIFEGDIVKGLFVFGEISSVVIFKYGYFGIEWNIDEIKVLDPFLGLRNIECEVIGNIHDNPELLKGGDDK